MSEIDTIEIERKVLGEILSLDTANEQLEILCELGVKEFSESKFLQLFKSMCTIAQTGNKIDTIALLPFVNTGGYMTIGELAELNSDIISTAHIGTHIAILKEARYKKDLLKVIDKRKKEIIEQPMHDDVEAAKEGLVADLSGLSLVNESKFVNLAEVKEKLIHNIESGAEVQGYSWGKNLEALDKITGGISRPRLIVLGGLKKGGKTRFVISTQVGLYYQGVPTAFMSLEMPPYEVNKMYTSKFLEINDLLLSSRKLLSKKQIDQIKCLKIDERLLKVECASSLSIEDVLLRLRRYAKLGVKVVFIDFLQRMKMDSNNKVAELEDYSKAIADATRSYDISVVLLSQLRNSAEMQAPTVGDLKGSGGIAEAADTIILVDNVYRRTKDPAAKFTDDNNNPTGVKLDFIIDQRYGDSAVLPILGNLGTCDFRDLHIEASKEEKERNEKVQQTIKDSRYSGKNSTRQPYVKGKYDQQFDN